MLIQRLYCIVYIWALPLVEAAGLYANTTQALGAGPVSATIPNVGLSEPGFAKLKNFQDASLSLCELSARD